MADEITPKEKAWAGFLLILFTALPVFFLIALWPDRMPDASHPANLSYHFKMFRVRLANDSLPGKDTTAIDSAKLKKPGNIISSKSAKNGDSDTSNKNGKSPAADTANTAIKEAPRNSMAAAINKKESAEDASCLISINTILLILVALGGFLGNMIHISTSFTTYIGAEQFKRSWLLWYYVRPFSAAALAVGLYFVFRAGFLTLNNDPVNINLYGVMTLSVLAGLFTDKTTQKLKEIFEVVFRSKEERPDTLDPKAKIKSIAPVIISAGIENILTLSGENLDAKLKATINDEVVVITDKAKESATIKYTIPATQKDKTEFVVLVKDDENNTLLREILKLKQEAASPPPPSAPISPGGSGGANAPSITIAPLEIETGKESMLILGGENLAAILTATINAEEVPITDIKEKSAAIKYTITEVQKDKTEFIVLIKDAKGNILLTQKLALKTG